MSEKHFLEPSEIPLYNWEKCTQGKYNYMRRKDYIGKEHNKEDVNAFYSLLEKYFEQFGLGEEMKNYILIKKKIIRLNIKFIETGNLVYWNQLKIERAKLKDAEPKETNKVSISEVLIRISKLFRTWYNKKEITLEDFKYLTIEYERESNKR